MSVLRGHEDLKPKAIVGFDMGFALVDCGVYGVKRYRMTIGPAGNLHAEPVQEDNLPDQVGTIANDHRVRAHASVDQV